MNPDQRRYSWKDHFVAGLDQALRGSLGPTPKANRPNPGNLVSEQPLTDEARHLSARLLRVNHAGEVCAQALYQGQGLTAKNPDSRELLKESAEEETDHLAWTQERLDQLGDHRSYLTPVWYFGSLAIGAFAGSLGDRWNLGFLAETENQVVKHLDGHLARLPEQDMKSRAILEQMRDDELHHATTAITAGGAKLPEGVKSLMRLSSKVMTTLAYWI